MRNKPIYVTQPQMPPLEEFIPLLENIWESKVLTNRGAYHQQLEQSLREYLGVEHLALCTNATIALMVSLKALDIGGEVITTPYTFVATTNAIAWNGCTPVFADLSQDSFNIDPRKIEQKINENTAAILPVHCYGVPCDVEAIKAIAQAHQLPVIYDASHAFAVNDAAGSILRHGDISILSFHATKVFSTLEGAAIICKDEDLLQRINEISNHGITDPISVQRLGINGKLNEISAAYGLALLRHVDEGIRARKKIDQMYRTFLSDIDGIHMMHIREGTSSNYNYFPILVGQRYPVSREQLHQKLCEADIYARRYFYPLTSSFPMYCNLPSSGASNLPLATKLSEQVLCLPIYADLSKEDVLRVIDCIKSVV